MKLNYCQARDSDPSPVQLSLKLGQQLKLSILIISRVFLVHFRFFSLSCCFSRTHALKTIITEIDFIKPLFLNVLLKAHAQLKTTIKPDIRFKR